jgi:hypothetical protein
LHLFTSGEACSNYRNVAGKASSKNLPLPFLRGEGTGETEAAKLPDAGISLKQCPEKMSGRKRLATELRNQSESPTGAVVDRSR